MNRLLWQNIAPAMNVHVASTCINDRYVKDLHTHDFYELFLVESGSGVHLLQGSENKLLPGDLLYVKREHCHNLRGTDLHIINIAFPDAVLQPLMALCPRLQDIYQAAEPVQCRSTPLQRERIHYWSRMLRPQADSVTCIQAMLLDVIRSEADETESANMPAWLAEGLQRISEPPLLSEGMQALVHVTQRSREYIWRMCKQSTQQRPQDLINELRMRYAERQLRLSGDSILSICYDCGLSNISHFYRLFKQHCGVTPKQYRQRYQDAVT